MARMDGNPNESMRPGAGSTSTGTSASTSGVVGTVQGAANSASQTVQNKAAPLVDAATEKAGEVADQAKEQATSRLDMGKDFAVESLTGVAQALRQTGQHLRQDGSQPTLGGYADTGAEQIERFSGYLRQRDTQQLLSDVEAYARRSPTMFASGAFALGLLAARFFRSSGARAGSSSIGGTSSLPSRSTGTAGTYSSGSKPAAAGTMPTSPMSTGSAGMPSATGRPAGLPAPTAPPRPAAPAPTSAPRIGTPNSSGTPGQTPGQGLGAGGSSAQPERADPSRSPRV